MVGRPADTWLRAGSIVVASRILLRSASDQVRQLASVHMRFWRGPSGATWQRQLDAAA